MDCDIAIVGGGHTGLLLAASLAGSGWSTKIVEPAPLAGAEDRRDGRNLALLRGSCEIARELGVWRAVATIAEPVERVELAERPGGACASWDAADFGGEPFAWGVEHGPLRDALARPVLDRLGDGVHLRTAVVGLTRVRGRAQLHLADGGRLRARLVVGADGRGSRIRELAGIRLDRWSYGHAAVTLVLHRRGPADRTIREWLRPAGPLALLPLRDGRLGVTWVEPEERARTLGGLAADRLLAALAAETDGATAGARLADGPSVWPLSAQHAVRYAAPRVVLVGDAAHGVHPIHAQGFNMAVADVAVLHELLVGARGRGADPGDPGLLLAYERRRRPANRGRIWMTDGLVRIFSNDLPLLGAVRRAALGLVASVPPLARLAVAHGTRLT